MFIGGLYKFHTCWGSWFFLESPRHQVAKRARFMQTPPKSRHVGGVPGQVRGVSGVKLKFPGLKVRKYDEFTSLVSNLWLSVCSQTASLGIQDVIVYSKCNVMLTLLWLVRNTEKLKLCRISRQLWLTIRAHGMGVEELQKWSGGRKDLEAVCVPRGQRY